MTDTTPTTEPNPAADALDAEAEWLHTAHDNATHRSTYSPEYLRGFAAAAGWVRFHAEAQREHGHRLEDV